MNATELKEKRKKAKLTQEALAEIVKQSWEQGQRNITQSAISLLEYYKETVQESTPYCEVEEEELLYLPLLPVSAQGGSLSYFTAQVKETDCEKIISPIKDADFAIRIYGDSMYPEYPSGSQILIKKINENAFIDWGETYVLDTCNGVILKKVLPSTNKENNIKCVSINPQYPPFEINKKDIFGMYRVLMCLVMK